MPFACVFGTFSARRSLLLAMAGLLFAVQASGQLLPVPPPGGFGLRRVKHLKAAPQPPGGLVPYRVGKRWGYADTTGRLWIKPVFAAHPVLFQTDFVLVTHDTSNPEATSWHVRTERLSTGETTIFNARGECLRASPDEAVLVEPDGSLVVRKRYRAAGRTELLRTDDNRGCRPLWPTTQPVQSAYLGIPPPLYARGVREPEQVARNRFAGVYVSAAKPERRPTRKPKSASGTRPDRARQKPPRQPASDPEPESVRYGLFDDRGRRVAVFRNAYLTPLSATRMALHHLGQYLVTVVNRQGRPVTRTRFASVTPFRRGVACVVVPDSAGRGYEHRRFALIDTAGAYRLPPRPTPLSGPDDAGLLRAVVLTTAPSGQVRRQVQFLRPSGDAAFPGLFDEAGPFWQGRAPVKVGHRTGIIDTLGRFVFPLLAAPPPDAEHPTRIGPVEARGAAGLRVPESAAGYAGPVASSFTFKPWIYWGPAALPAPPADSLPGADVVQTASGYFGLEHGHPRLISEDEEVLELPDLPPSAAEGPAPVANFFFVRQHLCLDTTGLPKAPWRSRDLCREVRRNVPHTGSGHGYLIAGSTMIDPEQHGFRRHFVARTTTEWLVFDLAGRLHYRAALPDSLARRLNASPSPRLFRTPPPPAVAFRLSPQGKPYRLENPARQAVSRRQYCVAHHLAANWFAVTPADSALAHDCQGQWREPTVLLTPDCREIPAPAGATFPYDVSGRPYPDAGALPPFARGVVLTSKGYLTKGGRQLWREE